MRIVFLSPAGLRRTLKPNLNRGVQRGVFLHR